MFLFPFSSPCRKCRGLLAIVYTIRDEWAILRRLEFIVFALLIESVSAIKITAYASGVQYSTVWCNESRVMAAERQLDTTDAGHGEGRWTDAEMDFVDGSGRWTSWDVARNGE